MGPEINTISERICGTDGFYVWSERLRMETGTVMM